MSTSIEVAAAFRPLAAAEVHLWVTRESHNESSASFAENLATLDERQRERAARFLVPLARQRYVNSHAFLRRTLAAYTGLAPADLRYERSAKGKPSLAMDARLSDGASAPHFSLAHSGDATAVALSVGGAIGVDLEEYRALSDVEELMRICLTAEELELVSGVNGAESRAGHFYRVWTLKEAALKAVGTGLTIPISSFSVLRDLTTVAGAEVRLADVEHGLAALAVYLTEVPLLAGHALAVASLTPIGRVVVMETGNPTIPQGA